MIAYSTSPCSSPGILYGHSPWKRPDEPQPGLLHHAPRCGVDRERVGEDSARAELGECLVDERPRPLGRVALAPCAALEPIPQLRFVLPVVLGSKMEPADELLALLLDDAPVPYPGQRSYCVSQWWSIASLNSDTPPVMKRVTSGSLSRSRSRSTSASVSFRRMSRSVSRKTSIGLARRASGWAGPARRMS